MKTLISIFLSGLALACFSGDHIVTSEAVPSEIRAKNPVIIDEPSADGKGRFKRPIKGVRGLLVLADKYAKPTDMIRVYNDDGSLWHEFSFYYDDSDGKFEYQKDDFLPHSFHPDYLTLALKVTAEDSGRYEVIVNEETGLRKFTKKSEANLKFETWESHILRTFAIEFDLERNPIRRVPAGDLIQGDLPNGVRFRPVKIESDWLQVRWEAPSESGGNPKSSDSGWIKWKDADHLLIDWFYFA
jgi:hypothetical protein